MGDTGPIFTFGEDSEVTKFEFNLATLFAYSKMVPEDLAGNMLHTVTLHTYAEFKVQNNLNYSIILTVKTNYSIPVFSTFKGKYKIEIKTPQSFRHGRTFFSSSGT